MGFRGNQGVQRGSARRSREHWEPGLTVSDRRTAELSAERPCRTCGFTSSSNSSSKEGLSPSQMQQYLSSIRREVVEATRWCDPTPPRRRYIPSSHSTGRTTSLRSSERDQELHVSVEEELRGRARKSESLPRMPSAVERSGSYNRRQNLGKLESSDNQSYVSSMDDESSRLLAECQEVRRRAQAEISQAMNVLNNTAPLQLHPHSTYRFELFTGTYVFQLHMCIVTCNLLHMFVNKTPNI